MVSQREKQFGAVSYHGLYARCVDRLSVPLCTYRDVRIAGFVSFASLPCSRAHVSVYWAVPMEQRPDILLISNAGAMRRPLLGHQLGQSHTILLLEVRVAAASLQKSTNKNFGGCLCNVTKSTFAGLLFDMGHELGVRFNSF